MWVKFDGGKLLCHRKEKNISQALMAEQADTTIRYIRDLEKGCKSNPSAVLVYLLSAVLGIRMEELMTKLPDEERKL